MTTTRTTRWPTRRDDHRWAFGTGFVDPLEGVDTSVPDGMDPVDLAAQCLMLADDALIYSHRLQQWVGPPARARGGDGGREHRARPARSDPAAARPRGRNQRPQRGRARLLPQRAGLPQRPARRGAGPGLRRTGRPPAGLRHLAPVAVRAVVGTWRPGARRHRRQGRERAYVPPRLRRAVGGPARRRHRGFQNENAGRPRGRSGRSSTSCSTPTPSAASSTWSSTPCSPPPRWSGPRPRRWPVSAVAAGREGVHTEALRLRAGRAAERRPRPSGRDMVRQPRPGTWRRRRPTRSCRC